MGSLLGGGVGRRETEQRLGQFCISRAYHKYCASHLLIAMPPSSVTLRSAPLGPSQSLLGGLALLSSSAAPGPAPPQCILISLSGVAAAPSLTRTLAGGSSPPPPREDVRESVLKSERPSGDRGVGLPRRTSFHRECARGEVQGVAPCADAGRSATELGRGDGRRAHDESTVVVLDFGLYELPCSSILVHKIAELADCEGRGEVSPPAPQRSECFARRLSSHRA